MAKAIYKYELAFVDGVQTLQILKHAKILSVANQMERFVFCAEVTPDLEMEPRYFVVRPTGANVAEDIGKYRGTALFANGMLVFHLYEVVGP